MKVLHVGNPANAAWRLAKAQCALGHQAEVLTMGPQSYGFPSDINLPTPWPGSRSLSALVRWPLMSRYDVIHVHGGFHPLDWIYPIFKRRWPSKVLAVHLHGTETRTGEGLHYLSSADLVFIATPDLLAKVPRARWIPNPIDLPLDISLDGPKNPRPIFGHFPSGDKGTPEIIRRFKEAFPHRDAALEIDRGLPHRAALDAMRSCDAVIDQHRPEIGAYGYVSIEAMALGKPVFCTLRPGLYSEFCPIMPIDILHLQSIAFNPALRTFKALEGRQYIAHVHESLRIARIVLQDYSACLRG